MNRKVTRLDDDQGPLDNEVRSFCYAFPSLHHPRPLPRPSKEDLNINLQRTNRIPQLKLLQHVRMQYAKGANHPLLPTHPQMNRRRMPLQERLIVHLADPIRALPRTLPLQTLLAGHESGFQHEHDAIHEPVDDFEAAVLGQKCGGEVALVAALALEGHVFEGYVADFEDFDGDAVVFVFPQRLQETREEGCADDLVFRRFRVGQSDGCSAVVDAIQVRKVFGMGAEDER